MDGFEVSSIVINAVLALVALGSMFAATAQARAARESKVEAASSSAEASALAKDANELYARMAAASEDLAEAVKSQGPQDGVAWDVQRGHRAVQLVMNVGTRMAFDVYLEGTEGVHIDEDSRRDVLEPGDAVQFAVWRGSGMPPSRLTLFWREVRHGEQQRRVFAVNPTN